MAINQIWKVHSLEYAPTATPLDAGNTFIGGITNVSMPVQGSPTRDVNAGKVFATSGRLDLTSVDIEVTTVQMDKLIDLVPVAGLCIGTTPEFYINVSVNECSGPLAGAQHRRYEINKGMVYFTNISCDHKGDLQGTVRIQAVFDGSNDPVAISDLTSLPSDVQVGDLTQRWTLHDGTKTTLGGAAWASKRSLSLDFNVDTSTQGADSEEFDSFGAIDQILPTLTVSGIDPSWFDQLGLGLSGSNVTHANTTIGFRKRDGGGFVADGTAEHIEMTVNGIAYNDQLFSASRNEAATSSIRVECLEDSSGNAPVILTTATAL
jgi:hypothetical protein